PDADIVADADRRWQQRMPQIARAEGWRVACLFDDLRERPGRIIRRQRRERLQLTQRLQPDAHPPPRRLLPPFEQPERVEAPQQKRLDDREEHREAQIAELQDTSQPTHLLVGVELLCRQIALDAPQPLRLEWLLGDAREDALIRLKNRLAVGDLVNQL